MTPADVPPPDRRIAPADRAAALARIADLRARLAECRDPADTMSEQGDRT